MADIVLPAATFLEQDGTTTNFSGRVQPLKAAFRPRERRDEMGNTLSACAPDWVIFTKLMQLIGKDAEVIDVKGWTERFRALPQNASAKSALQVVNYEVPQSVLHVGTDANEYSMRLLHGPILMDGGESFPFCERLNLRVPEPFVALHRADARKLGIENKATVEVRTSRGSVRVLAKVGRGVKEGTVWMPTRVRDVNVNQILATDAPFTNVQIVKIADAAPDETLVADGHAIGVGH